MTLVDSLLLDAKQAVLNEHHGRFRIPRLEGGPDEGLQQFRVTFSCVNDLLDESSVCWSPRSKTTKTSLIHPISRPKIDPPSADIA